MLRIVGTKRQNPTAMHCPMWSNWQIFATAEFISSYQRTHTKKRKNPHLSMGSEIKCTCNFRDRMKFGSVTTPPHCMYGEPCDLVVLLNAPKPIAYDLFVHKYDAFCNCLLLLSPSLGAHLLHIGCPLSARRLSSPHRHNTKPPSSSLPHRV